MTVFINIRPPLSPQGHSSKWSANLDEKWRVLFFGVKKRLSQMVFQSDECEIWERLQMRGERKAKRN